MRIRCKEEKKSEIEGGKKKGGERACRFSFVLNPFTPSEELRGFPRDRKRRKEAPR